MRRAHVLVVEHHRDLCEALADGLADEGYLVTPAMSQAAALSALRPAGPAQAPDAVVVDLLDGRDLVASLRGDPQLSGVAVVVLRHPFEEPVDADAEVRRPFRLEQLFEAVAAALRRRGFPLTPASQPPP